jgi:hypothetical protein
VMQAPGDLQARMRDLDREGVWGEVIYASLGLWENLITDRDLVRAASRAENEWKVTEVQALAPDRFRRRPCPCSTSTTRLPSCATPPSSGCTS